MAETFTIGGSVESVRAFMEDSEQVAQCMPGLESTNSIDDRTHDATLAFRTMGLTTRFDARVRITDEGPDFLAGRVAGKEVKSDTDFELEGQIRFERVSAELTQVAFEAAGTIDGKLAGPGVAWMIRAKSKELSKQFAVAMAQRVEAQKHP
jgi:carbon monoxide dehydrogenase subunit G